MKNYSVLLFDADDTLLDFKKAERCAVSALLSGYGIAVSERIVQSYSEINAEVWKKLEKGEIKREKLSDLRFELFFERENIKFDPHEAGLIYYGLLSKQGQTLDGAIEILKYFHRKKTVCIVTNGMANVQKSRLKLSGINMYTDKVFISELVGANKPKKEFFDAVFDEIKAEKSDCLLVGDSLSADIKGGSDYGIDTCLLSPSSNPDCGNLTPTYIISSLSELKTICTP